MFSIYPLEFYWSSLLFSPAPSNWDIGCEKHDKRLKRNHPVKPLGGHQKSCFKWLSTEQKWTDLHCDIQLWSHCIPGIPRAQQYFHNKSYYNAIANDLKLQSVEKIYCTMNGISWLSVESESLKLTAVYWTACCQYHIDVHHISDTDFLSGFVWITWIPLTHFLNHEARNNSICLLLKIELKVGWTRVILI